MQYFLQYKSTGMLEYLNTCFLQFYYFCTVNKLVNPQDMFPLAPLIRTLTGDVIVDKEA